MTNNTSFEEARYKWYNHADFENEWFEKRLNTDYFIDEEKPIILRILRERASNTIIIPESIISRIHENLRTTKNKLIK